MGIKTIGLLTSGGDAPGMNAAIRAVVRAGIYYGLKIKGIRHGYEGLINGDIIDLHISSVADIIQRGGTILGTARSKEFETAEGQKKAMEALKDNDIEGLVVLGGDGSFRGAKALSDRGILTIGIPCTIDNDMGYTEKCIGFSTAVDTVVEAIGKLRDTSTSHGRAHIIEVMGRHCGDIALYSGVAGGAESIIVPELPFNLDDVMAKVIKGKMRGKKHNIIVLAEKVGNPYDIARTIEDTTGIVTRVTVLGYIQRGGTPSSADRLLASKMGHEAVKHLIEGKTNLAIGSESETLFSLPIEEAVAIPHTFDHDLYAIAQTLSI